MATRASRRAGARASGDAALVLDAAGKDIVIIETVGVGQDEVDIIRRRTCRCDAVPGTGDDVQALKAGIRRSPTSSSSTKGPRGGHRLVSSVEANLALHAYAAGVAAADQKTVATSGAGIPEPVAAIDAFQAHSAARRRRAARPERVPAARAHLASFHGAPRARRARRRRARLDGRPHRRPRARSHTAANDLLARALQSPDRQSPNQLPNYPITRLPNP
jgi:LAO/AO transport system kinase